MNNLKISTRLSAAFGILVLALVAVAGVALMQLSAMHQTTQRITDNILVSVQLLNRLNTDLTKARLLELRHVFNEGEAYKANVEREMQALQEEMDGIKVDYEKLINSPAERQTYENLLTQRKEYVALMQTLFQVSRGGEQERAREMLGARSLELYNLSSKTLVDIINIKKQQSADEVAGTQRVYDTSLMLLIDP